MVIGTEQPAMTTGDHPSSGVVPGALGMRDVAPFALVGLATIVALEGMRVLFSVAYHAGESIGWTTAGLLVVAAFAAPAVGAPLRRVIAPSNLLAVGVAGAVLGRLALQLVGDISFALALAATGLALVALSLAVVALDQHRVDGWLSSAVALTVGAALDVVVRATDATWDIVWRRDLTAWALTLALVAGLAVALVLSVRAGAVPDGERRGSGPATFLLWPYLYFLIFYVQSPAFIDTAGGVDLVVGVAVALIDATIAVVVLGFAARRPLPVWVAVAIAGVVVVAGYLLPSATGWPAIGLCLAAQVGVAGLVGRAVGAERGVAHDRITRSVLAFAAGGVLAATAALLYSLHTIQPLPFSNRLVPAGMGLVLVVAALAPTARAGTGSPVLGRPVGVVAGALAALAVVVPMGVALTWPNAATVAVADRPLKVMTFNIEQGLTLGQLHLEEMAHLVDAADPDVVVMEEVGRGWSLSGMTDEGEWFRRRLRMEDAWGPAADNQFGNLVLTRVPVSERDVLALGKGHGTQDRSAIFVTLDLGDGRTTRLIGTHLQNGSPPQFHETRAQEYQDILDRWNGAPNTVFIGDLNTYPRQVPPGWPELNLVLDAGFHTTQDLDQCVMPTSNANCPDWIFVSPDVQLSAVSIVVDRPDHRPITAAVTPAG